MLFTGSLNFALSKSVFSISLNLLFSICFCVISNLFLPSPQSSPGSFIAMNTPACGVSVDACGIVVNCCRKAHAPVSQLVEETASKSVQCGFESHRGHQMARAEVRWFSNVPRPSLFPAVCRFGHVLDTKKIRAGSGHARRRAWTRPADPRRTGPRTRPGSLRPTCGRACAAGP